jgi:hypothetical protein
MGKHWVYVLKYYYIDDEYKERIHGLYIGETTRLYRRFNEHIHGNGGKNTKYFGDTTDRIQLVGLYDVSNNCEYEKYKYVISTFYDYYSIMQFEELVKQWRWRTQNESEEHDFLMIENCITEMCITLNKNTNVVVKGGKYTKDRSYKEMTFPTYERPLCKCGYPSEVFLSKKSEVWFKCAVSNTNWLDYHDRLFTISEPCDFIQKYIGDIELRQKYDTYNKSVEKIPKIWNVGRDENWLQSTPCIVCKKRKYSPIYSNGYRAICKLCLEERFDDIDTTVNNHKGIFMLREDTHGMIS